MALETFHAFEETVRALREGAKLCVPNATDGKVHLDSTPDGWTITVAVETRDAEGTYLHTLYAPEVALGIAVSTAYAILRENRS